MSEIALADSGCARCGSPLEDGDLRCAVCALPVPADAAGAARVRVQVLRCTWCGAAIGYDASHHAPACAFCRSVMTIEQPVDPIEVAERRVAFAVAREGAVAALRAWLGERGWLAPKALRDEAVVDGVEPIAWAAWVVRANAAVTWTCDSDDGARRSRWAPHAGTFDMDLADVIVPASRGLTADECARLAPHYELYAARAVAAAGEPCESFDAQRSAARREVQRAIEAAARTRVESAAPGTRFRNIHVACLVERQSTERVALPAWVMAYRYRGNVYRAIVHGQRADVVVGRAPVDWAKLAKLAGIVLAVAAAIAALVLALR